MKTLRKFGAIRPSGQKVTLREDRDGEERLACISIQSVSKQQGTVGAWLNVDEATVLLGWLRSFALDRGNDKEVKRGEAMKPTCGTLARWAIVPYVDPNEAAMSCDAHLVSFLDGASSNRKKTAGVKGFNVYPIVHGKRGPLCRHRGAAKR